MSEAIRAILDAVTDRVLSFRPTDKGQQAKKIERRVKRPSGGHPGLALWRMRAIFSAP